MTDYTPDTVRGLFSTAVQMNPAAAPAYLNNMQQYDMAYQARQDNIVQNNLQEQLGTAQQETAQVQATATSLQSQVEEDQAILQQQIQTDATALASAVAAQKLADTTQYSQCTWDDKSNIQKLLATYDDLVIQNARLVAASNRINQDPSISTDLSGEIQELQQKQAALKGSIEQTNRDFVDLRDAMPEQIPNTNVHLLDDYTMWILVLSYSLFVVSVIFYYCHTHNYALNSILISTVTAGILTIFLFLLMILLL